MSRVVVVVSGLCKEDVRHLADAMCSGRRKCEIAIPNSDFDAKLPCPKDLKSYLEIHYRCLDGESRPFLCSLVGPSDIILPNSGLWLSLISPFFLIPDFSHTCLRIFSDHEFHETCHSVTFYFMKKDS